MLWWNGTEFSVFLNSIQKPMRMLSAASLGGFSLPRMISPPEEVHAWVHPRLISISFWVKSSTEERAADFYLTLDLARLKEREDATWRGARGRDGLLPRRNREARVQPRRESGFRHVRRVRRPANECAPIARRSTNSSEANFEYLDATFDVFPRGWKVNEPQRALGPHNGYGSVWGEELNTHTRTTTIEQQTFRKSKNDWSIKRSPLTYLNLLYPCGHPKRGVLACPKFPPPLATSPNPDFFPKRPAHLSVIGFKEKIDPLNAVPGGIYLNQRFVSFFLHSSINLHL